MAILGTAVAAGAFTLAELLLSKGGRAALKNLFKRAPGKASFLKNKFVRRAGAGAGGFAAFDLALQALTDGEPEIDKANRLLRPTASFHQGNQPTLEDMLAQLRGEQEDFGGFI